VQEMMHFNEVISNQRLEELKLNGNKFTWTNKQSSPLLKRLDWMFASASWLANYPSSSVSSLSRDISDHSPCLIHISTDIPKARIFIFENYWLLHDDFMQVMQHGWHIPVVNTDNAKKLTAKFKNLRRVLKAWQLQLSNLASVISNNQMVILFLDILEEFRDLSHEEWNFRFVVQDNLGKLLEQERVYWRQRGRITWATLRDENTKFFHANASIRHNKNTIMSLKNSNG
jgi:hypothetical protein